MPLFLTKPGNVALPPGPPWCQQISHVAILGRLDIAVANAGIARGGTLLELPLKDWQDQLDINLTGVFLTVQATARKMVELGHGGRIICMSSLAAERTGAQTWAYSTTKAGVRMMVRGWAQELGPYGITFQIPRCAALHEFTPT
jgi:NAD(P)-dependent dehydrogenase (short-subunit alcohol dehydrogenase family)